MATENPPSYHEVVGQLKGMTPEQQKKCHEIVSAEFEKKETKKSLLQEVKALTESIAEAKRLFFDVTVDLSKITDKAADGVKGEWDAIYEEYKKLMGESRESAKNAILYLDEFVDIVMARIAAVTGPDDVKGREEALTVLKDFLEKIQTGKELDLEDLEKKGDIYHEKFDELKIRVGKFVGVFKAYADSRGAELTKEIETARSDLTRLNKELNEANAEVTKWAIALGLTGFGVAVGAWLGFAFLGPFGLIAALVVGLAAIGYEIYRFQDAIQKAGAKQAEVNAAKEKLDKLLAEQELLKQLAGSIESHQGKVIAVSEKIAYIGHVWVAIGLDAKRLHAALDSFSKSRPDQSFDAFKDHVNQLKKYYDPLRSLLEAYVGQT